MTVFHCIKRLLRNLTSWLGMARRKQCSVGGSSEMQDMQQHDVPTIAIERRPTRKVPGT